MIGAIFARNRLRLLMPGAEAGTLRVRDDSDAGFTDYALQAVHQRRPATSIDQADAGGSEKVAARFVVRKETLEQATPSPAPMPRPSDVLVVASGSWTIRAVETALFGEVVNLRCELPV